MGRAWLLLALAAAGLPGCSKGGADYCKVYDDTSAELKQVNAEIADNLSHQKPSSEITFDQLEADIKRGTELLDRHTAILRKREAAAPDDLKAQWAAYFAGRPQLNTSGSTTLPPTLSVEKAYKDSVTAINAYAVDKCKLPGDLD